MVVISIRGKEEALAKVMDYSVVLLLFALCRVSRKSR